MTPAQIRRKWASIDRREDRLAQELAALQAACTHPSVNKKYCGNTGNYDPSADSYWIEFSCPDCRKKWITDQ